MNKFSENLKHLRESKALSQQELADLIGMSKSSVNMYERGEREPGFETIEVIADFFGVTTDYLFGRNKKVKKAVAVSDSKFDKNEVVLIRKYRTLDEHGKAIVTCVLDIEASRIKTQNSEPVLSVNECPVEYKYSKSNQDKVIAIKTVMIDVAAGFGNFPSDYVEVKEELYPYEAIPFGTDIAFVITGDSMEPDFHDGDTVFVKECAELSDGDVGIFVYDDGCFIKELKRDKESERAYLVSRNKNYNTTILPEDDSVKIIGKVLGRLP